MEKIKKRGRIVVISGPSGSGKGTLTAELEATGEYVLSVSRTTRAPRPGEVEANRYEFVTREEFDRLVREGDFLEYTAYCDQCYGTPLGKSNAILDSGKNLILEIDVEGAMNVKRLHPEAILIMLLPPDFATQEYRLRNRLPVLPEEVIRKRLDRTREEMKYLSGYDYVSLNYDGGIADCAEDVKAIVRAKSLEIGNYPDFEKTYFKN